MKLEPMTMSEWQAERQKFLDSLDSQTIAYNEAYRNAVRNNDAYHYGLAEDIRRRQEAAIPEAGEGFFQSIAYLGKSIIVVGRITGQPYVSALGTGTLRLGEYLQNEFV